MAEHAWTVLCQKVLEDTESKLMTLVDVFDQLIINPSPATPDAEAKLREVHEAGNKGVTFPARLRIVTQWFRSDRSQPETATCRLSFIDPSGERMFEQEMSIELAERTAQRITVRSDQIQITELGLYHFVVEKLMPTKGKRQRWSEVARLPLQVIVAKNS